MDSTLAGFSAEAKTFNWLLGSFATRTAMQLYADMVLEGSAAATSMTIVTSSQRPATRFICVLFTGR